MFPTDDGALWGCGSNKYGQLGQPREALPNSSKFVKLEIAIGSANIKDFKCREWGTVLVTDWACSFDNHFLKWKIKRQFFSLCVASSLIISRPRPFWTFLTHSSLLSTAKWIDVCVSTSLRPLWKMEELRATSSVLYLQNWNSRNLCSRLQGLFEELLYNTCYFLSTFFWPFHLIFKFFVKLHAKWYWVMLNEPHRSRCSKNKWQVISFHFYRLYENCVNESVS